MPRCLRPVDVRQSLFDALMLRVASACPAGPRDALSPPSSLADDLATEMLRLSQEHRALRALSGQRPPRPLRARALSAASSSSSLSSSLTTAATAAAATDGLSPSEHEAPPPPSRQPALTRPPRRGAPASLTVQPHISWSASSSSPLPTPATTPASPVCPLLPHPSSSMAALRPQRTKHPRSHRAMPPGQSALDGPDARHSARLRQQQQQQQQQPHAPRPTPSIMVAQAAAPRGIATDSTANAPTGKGRKQQPWSIPRAPLPFSRAAAHNAPLSPLSPLSPLLPPLPQRRRASPTVRRSRHRRLASKPTAVPAPSMISYPPSEQAVHLDLPAGTADPHEQAVLLDDDTCDVHLAEQHQPGVAHLLRLLLMPLSSQVQAAAICLSSDPDDCALAVDHGGADDINNAAASCSRQDQQQQDLAAFDAQCPLLAWRRVDDGVECMNAMPRAAECPPSPPDADTVPGPWDQTALLLPRRASLPLPRTRRAFAADPADAAKRKRHQDDEIDPSLDLITSLKRPRHLLQVW